MACVKGFEILNPGQAEDYAACLAAITPEQACDIDPVAACTDAVYDNACTFDDVTGFCGELTDYCDAELGDTTLDAGICAADLNPMSVDAINGMVECMSWTHGTCEERYVDCFDEMISVY
jgi:hypothetical protein